MRRPSLRPRYGGEFRFSWLMGGGESHPTEGQRLLVNAPSTLPDDVPQIWALDLEILDAADGLPPAHTGYFLVSYGADGDHREHRFAPGIHVLIASHLRVLAVPVPGSLAGPGTHIYRASACPVSAPPSYSWF